jgi:predicted RNA-binding Zn-ribbon protein involved in translation (DUF1610 family)
MACSKRNFKSADEANNAVKQYLQKYKRNNYSSYNCPHCPYFHITTCDSKRREEARIASKGVKEG